MNHSSIASLLVVVPVIVACSSGGEAEVLRLSEGNLAALAHLGIADVELAHERFLLTDEHGDPVGEVTMTSDASVTATLLGASAETTRGPDGTIVECNGEALAFVAGASVAADAAATVAPCQDALEAAAIVVGASVGLDASSADQDPRLASSCIFLGANIWCDGTTAIVSFDSLCMNDPSDPFTNQWVETDTWFHPDAAYCAGCCS